MNQQYSSQLLERAVDELSKLPSVGRKTALRHALSLLRRPTEEVDVFVDSIRRMRHEIKFCRVCHNISDTEVCSICANPKRDRSLVCVVENVQDVLAIENTQQYNGLYHVLGGIISPVDGIGPSDLEIDSLVERVASPPTPPPSGRGVDTPEGCEVKEVILALSTTMEGDTTNFFISRKLQGLPVKLSVIARGISVGNEIEYIDEVTLGRSIMARTPFQ